MQRNLLPFSFSGMNPSSNPDQLVECLSSCIESIQRLKALAPTQNVVRHAELDLMAGMNTLFLRFHQQINGQQEASTGPQAAFTTMLQSVFGSTDNSASIASSVAASGNSGSGSNFSSTAAPSSLPALQLQEEKIEEEETKGRKKRSRKSRPDAEEKVGTKVSRI